MPDQDAPSAQEILARCLLLPQGSVQAASVPIWRMWLSAWVVLAVFTLSNTATPLYAIWQQTLGLTYSTLTLIFAAYTLGVVLTLLVAGQLSERVGRKAVMIPGLVAAIGAAVMFQVSVSVGALMLARFFTGVATAAIVCAGTANVVDNGGTTRRKLSSVVASMAVIMGAGLGPLLAGLIAQFNPDPVNALYTLELIVLFSAFAIVWNMPDSPRAWIARASAKSCFPSVPTANWVHLRIGFSLFGPSITAIAFLLSLGPLLLSNLLHISSPLIAGGMAFLMCSCAAGMKWLVRHLPLERVLYLSAGTTFSAMLCLLTAVHPALAHILTSGQCALLLVLTALLAGAGQGLGCLGGLDLIAHKVPKTRRAQANITMCLLSFIPAGLLPVAIGFLIDHTNLGAGASTLAMILAVCTCLAALYVAKNQDEIRTGS